MTHSEQKKRYGKLITFLLVDVLIIIGFIVYFGIISPRLSNHQVMKIDGVVLPQGEAIDDFQLTDNKGHQFTKQNLLGRWTMMFFGFTNCGMVCPTTMAELNKTYKMLQKNLAQNELPQVVMVSVDPDVDSVARMNSYVNAFNPNFIGVRADIDHTVQLEKQLHIAAAKIQVDGAGKHHYTINHTADILLFNPKGELVAYLSYPHQADQMAKDYQLILAQSAENKIYQ